MDSTLTPSTNNQQTVTVRPLLDFAGLGAALVLFLGQAWLFRGYFIDDSLITFRFVQQLLAGNGLVYNIGERVEGYSNFLWVILLSLAARGGFDLVIASKVLGVGFGAASIATVWHFAAPLRYRSLSALLLASFAPYAIWSVGGLETHLFCFLLTLAVTRFAREQERGGWASGLFFGLASLARPEGLLFAGVAFLYRAAGQWRRARRLESGLAVWLGLCGVLVLPHGLWRLWYYGYPLPNTVYAKSLGLFNIRGIFEGVYYLLEGVTALGGLVAVVAPIVLLLLWKGQPGWTRYLAVNLAVFCAFVIQAGGDWMPYQRLIVQVVPMAVLLVHDGVSAGAGLLNLARQRQALVAVLAAHLLYLVYGGLEARFLGGVGAGPVSQSAEADPMIRLLRSELKPGDTIAVDVAGGLAYHLPVDIMVVDLNGLTDAHIAHRPPQFPSGLFGRGDAFGKWDVEYVLSRQPKFVQVAFTGVAADGRLLTTNTGQTLLINDPRFTAQYTGVTAPGVQGLFQRRG